MDVAQADLGDVYWLLKAFFPFTFFFKVLTEAQEK